MTDVHTAWGVFQYDIGDGVPPSETASALEQGRARALADLARHGGDLVGALDHAPFLAASFPTLGSFERFGGGATIVRASRGIGPFEIEGSLDAHAGSACLCTLDEGAPHPRAAGSLRLEVRGDPRPFGHPTRILRTVAEAFDDDTQVLAIGLPREATQWPWMQAMDRALSSGVRLFLLSWGRLPLEEMQGWDLLETAIECFVTANACFVAAAGNTFGGADALLPARSPLVLGVGGTCRDQDRWEPYDATCFGPRVTNELSALVDDPESGSGGTSFATARVASRLARWMAVHPDASSQRLRAVVLVSASPRAADPRGHHDAQARVGRSLGLGDPDEEAMQTADAVEGRGPGSIELERPSKVVITWNCRPFAWLFRATGPRTRALRVDAPVVFAAESWLLLESSARSLAVDAAEGCPWAAAWLPL